jgi:rare lipoprotein A
MTRSSLASSSIPFADRSRDALPALVRVVGLVLVALALGGCGSMHALGDRLGMHRGAAPAASTTDLADGGVRMPEAPIPAPVVEAPAMPPAATAPIAEPKRPAAAPSRIVARRPAPGMQRRPGAYFQNDGPGEIPPELLLAVPEPAPRQEPLADYANRSYKVFGKTYHPATARARVRQVGLASWYGRQFHGRKTAIGERYDMYAVSAAHPTLPLPSWVRVTNLETKRTIVVRVNDRGPFHPGRIIDLSYAAASKLGFADKGSARVAIETIVGDDLRTPTLAMETGGSARALPPAFR